MSAGHRRPPLNRSPAASRAFVIAIFCAIAFTGCAAYPTRSAGGDSALNLRGYDPVAYFTLGRPTAGRAEFTATHAGLTYRFASAAHRALFVREPARYAPQYGGWCAHGVSYDVKLGSDPEWFRIVDGRLFIFGDAEGHDFTGMDLTGHIERADRYWPAMRDTGWGWRYLKRVVFNRVPHWRDGEELECAWLARHPDRPHAMFKGRLLDCTRWSEKRLLD